MALEGTLSDFNIHEIFQKIGDSQNTGILTIYSGEDTVTVTFLEGQVVAATSSDKRAEDRLGNFLVKQGYVSDSDLKRALADQEQTLDRLGQILLKKKIIDKPTLQKALQEQLKQIVGRLLQLNKGFYHFKVEEKVHYDQENVIPTPVEAIILSSVTGDIDDDDDEVDIPAMDVRFRKTQAADDFIVKELKSLGAFLIGDEKKPPPPTESSDGPDVSPLQKRLIKTLEVERSLNEIFAEHSESRAEVVRALDELKRIGFVEEVTPTEQEGDEAFDTDFDDFYEEEETLSLVSLMPFLMAVLILVGALFFGGDPFKPFTSSPITGSIEDTKLQVNMDRILTQMRMHAYQNQGQPPAVVNSLVDENLLSPVYAEDPWSQDYRYSVKQFRLILTSVGPNPSPEVTGDNTTYGVTYLNYRQPPTGFFPPSMNAMDAFLDRLESSQGEL